MNFVIRAEINGKYYKYYTKTKEEFQKLIDILNKVEIEFKILGANNEEL